VLSQNAVQLSKVAEIAISLCDRLSLEEKVSFITGFDFWNTVPNEAIGLRKMLLSDGPAGVRGEVWDERDNSLNLTSGTALGSSWSVEFAAAYGQTLAKEAIRKGVDVVLGPTINLHRSPLGGRHFECLSEDPLLTGSLAASYITAMQEAGIAACPKHFVGNDFESDRYNVDVRMDERTLREVYLRPFEDAVVEGGAWTIMSSYNKVNGTTLTESALLNEPLRTEWGFDGVVISDWTAVRSLASAEAEQDLEMPGPTLAWGDNLLEAIRGGSIDESVIDRKVVRLLVLAMRVGALSEAGQPTREPAKHNEIATESVAFARRAVAEGSVLLKNDGLLPLSLQKVGKVALIGHNASAARTQGGGSATVMPKLVVTPLDALKAELGANVTYSIGAVVQEGIAELESTGLRNPVTGAAGVHVDFIGENGEILHSEDRLNTGLMWVGADVPLPTSAYLRLTTSYTPKESGTVLFGYASVQPTEIKIGGEIFLQDSLYRETDDPFLGLMDPPCSSKALDLVSGKTIDIEIMVDLAGRIGLGVASQSFTFGIETDRSRASEYIAEAVLQAKSSDLAIVVVGTNSKVESEGFDRKNLDLPGRQDELVEAVVAANPNTIVIVNSGSPVLMPWRDKVRAILVTYFGGQEMGNGLVGILTGATEPGGRLPTTWPKVLEDVPVLSCTAQQPGNHVTYDEGIHVGYRAWLKAGTVPAYEFGFGLGYTTWSVSELLSPLEVQPGEDFDLTVKVQNTGSRFGKQIIQIYASKNDSTLDRPVRWLVGFAEVHANAGEEKFVSISIKGREFAHWIDGWNYELGTFQLFAGTSVSQLHASKNLVIGG
jgi:beta-glucosidase